VNRLASRSPRCGPDDGRMRPERHFGDTQRGVLRHVAARVMRRSSPVRRSDRQRVPVGREAPERSIPSVSWRHPGFRKRPPDPLGNSRYRAPRPGRQRARNAPRPGAWGTLFVRAYRVAYRSRVPKVSPRCRSRDVHCLADASRGVIDWRLYGARPSVSSVDSHCVRLLDLQGLARVVVATPSSARPPLGLRDVKMRRCNSA
jgi:hypothetical protein